MRKQMEIETKNRVIKQVIEGDNQVTVKKEQGITLIALVVTIIIMLILAGVTLTIALGENGLISQARFAANKTTEAKGKEQQTMNGAEKIIEDVYSDNFEIKIGDVVNYTPHTETDTYVLKASNSGDTADQTIQRQTYNWKVMNKKNDGTIEIMGVPTSAMPVVRFKGPTGYNNGVYLLNDMCKELYSNSDLGVEARSINLEDIESHLTESGKEERDKFKYYYGDKKYGETQIYTESNINYPKLAKYEDHVGIDKDTVYSDGIKESEGEAEEKDIKIPLEESNINDYLQSKEQASSSLTVKQTYYCVTQQSSYDDLNFYNLIFKTDGIHYWVASRYSTCYNDYAGFGIRFAPYEISYKNSLFYSSGDTNVDYDRLAPVVSLNSDIIFSKQNDGMWGLSKAK